MPPRPDRRRSRPATGALLALVLTAGAAACSSGGGLPASGGRPPATAGGTATASASDPGTPAAGAVTLDERSAGTTVRVRTGTAVTVLLHSTYWSIPAASAPKVLAPAADGATSPGATCRPGGGCGTTTARFTARQPGTARITASRRSCGEAKPCSPAQSSYDVTVAVTG
ncbi:protease inhibitor I42 family protein [Streptacidiphilus sp. ASG 303]|uniref:protease inhibitor I42 family protein n=1 Tax=Streptacidiphilus sp. ASG 303 TaxID=2896847 RepID=UPI001E5565E7|nr:protease inhibitor I42 family protein [Streptacidiphilus sp. ASG 303]MCD0484177.1 protease inhibitor I42 family protein [Streptacidiphilus sp. ASG 303]